MDRMTSAGAVPSCSHDLPKMTNAERCKNYRIRISGIKSQFYEERRIKNAERAKKWRENRKLAEVRFDRDYQSQLHEERRRKAREISRKWREKKKLEKNKEASTSAANILETKSNWSKETNDERSNAHKIRDDAIQSLSCNQSKKTAAERAKQWRENRKLSATTTDLQHNFSNRVTDIQSQLHEERKRKARERSKKWREKRKLSRSVADLTSSVNETTARGNQEQIYNFDAVQNDALNQQWTAFTQINAVNAEENVPFSAHDNSTGSPVFLARNRRANVESTNETSNTLDFGITNALEVKFEDSGEGMDEQIIQENASDNTIGSPSFLARNRRANVQSTNETSNTLEFEVTKNDQQRSLDVHYEEDISCASRRPDSTEFQMHVKRELAGTDEEAEMQEDISCGEEVHMESSLGNANAAHSRIANLCRLCLVELDAFASIYEFDEVYRFNIADAMNDLLGMDVDPGDGYPAKICRTCLDEVAHFWRFKSKCFESKAKLKEMMADSNYCAGNIKVEDSDETFEVIENELGEIPLQFVVPEVASEVEDASVQLQRYVQGESPGSDEEAERQEDISSEEVCVPSEPPSCDLETSSSEKCTSDLSEGTEEMFLKNDFVIYCDPVSISDDVPEESVENSNCDEKISEDKGRKTPRSTPACSSVTILTKNGDRVSIKMESSEEDPVNNQQLYSYKEILSTSPQRDDPDFSSTCSRR